MLQAIFNFFPPTLFASATVFLSFSPLLRSFSLYPPLPFFQSPYLPLSLSCSVSPSFAPSSLFLSLPRPGKCAVSAGGVIWCRRRRVIDNGAGFAIRRAVFAFKENETETETGGIASSRGIKRQECKTNRDRSPKWRQERGKEVLLAHLPKFGWCLCVIRYFLLVTYSLCKPHNQMLFHVWMRCPCCLFNFCPFPSVLGFFSWL